jgi:hypothetical protein
MADSTITDLTEITTLTNTDVFPVDTLVVGLPVTKKISWANIKAFLDGLFAPLATTTGSTYTPTLFNTTNIDASTAIVLRYSRVGNVCRVDGQVQVDATAAGNTVLGMSLPIASNFATSTQCTGLGISNGTNNPIVFITGDATNDRATLTYSTTSTTNTTITFSFGYQII